MKPVIDNGLCIWCWVCAFHDDSYDMELDSYWMIQAKHNWKKEWNKKTDEVCPFSNTSDNEDIIWKRLYSEQKNHKYIWYHMWLYAWSVSEWSYRKLWSSWWVGSWILKELLERKLVDKVVHVRATESNKLFEYAISWNIEEMRIWAKSKYYPITFIDVLKLIEQSDDRFAIVWIPCFIKSIRLLIKKNKDLESKIKFCIWLVCGHLKSSKFWEMLARQLWYTQKDLKAIDFREKDDTKSADNYWFSATNKAWKKEVKSMKSLFGWNWWANFFKYKACDYCDDTFAETADMTIGDAWIPRYSKDSWWNNVVITRNDILNTIIKEWIDAWKLNFDILSEEEVILSQRSWIRHKNKWLAYRLFYKKTPIDKRVEPSSDIWLYYKMIFRMRVVLRDQSHRFYKIAEKLNWFWIFKILIAPALFVYYFIYWVSYILRKLKAIINYN